MITTLTGIALASWYVATGGSSGNPGTLASPWDLATGISSGSIAAGDTVYFRAGTYTGHNVVAISGSVGSPISFRPYNRERVIFDRQVQAAGDNAFIKVTGSYTRWFNFEFTNSNTGRTSSDDVSNPSDARPTGWESFGVGNYLVNCIIHDVGGGFAMWGDTATDGSVAYGNIVFDNGWQAASRGHSHGAYIQGRDKLFSNNIFFGGFNQGAQMYGSGDTGLNLSTTTWDNNIFFNSGAMQLQGFERNLLVGGGQFCTTNTITNNDLFYPVGSSSQSLNAGYQATLFCVDFDISNNYMVGPLRIVGQRAAGASTTVANNTVYGPVGFEDTEPNGGFDSGFVSPYDASGNTIITVTPGANRIVVRGNAYEANRGTITVYNWTGVSTVAVDPSSFLAIGAPFQVHDVQNLFGSPVLTGTYTGGTITLPTDLTTRYVPIGVNAGTDFLLPAHTGSEFNVFLVTQTDQISSPSISLLGNVRATSGVRFR